MANIGDTSASVTRGFPAGGTAGQLLTKNSSADGDVSWANVPTLTGYPYLPVRSGGWNDTRPVLQSAGAAFSTGVNTASYAHYVNPIEAAIDRVAISIVTGTSISVNVGVYRSDPATAMPTQLIASVSATLNAGAALLNLSATLPKGLLWWGVVTTTTCTIRGIQYIVRFPLAMSDGPNNTNCYQYLTDSVSGSTLALRDNPSVLKTAGSVAPCFWWRYV